MEEATEQAVADRVGEAVEALWSFMAEQLGEVQKERRTEGAERSEENDTFSISSLTGTERPTRLSQQRLKRIS